MKTVRLVLAMHVHQPVGNLDEVMEAAMRDSYLPFLDVMKDFPDVPFCLHVSGCLFEWADRHHPEYLDKIADLAKAGKVEIVGGGRSEPIFPLLPERDAVGQIRSFSAQLEDRFGSRPCGAWLPERVWEQQLVRVFEAAGIQYSIVDDYHLKRAGLPQADLYNVFLTEDQGKILYLFPSSEKLRYLIPFKPVEDTIAFLRSVATEDGEALLVYADDGEKFGVWPGTKKHVYEDGWLRAFFEALRRNRDWIEIVTFSEAMGMARRPGLVFVPNASYREMTEWALPARTLASFHELEGKLERAGVLAEARPFFGGGFWRNFKVKYTEASNLYARMMESSESVAAVRDSDPAKDEATLDLYRGQCNCVYWHGVFGGLYLPHLRFAAYKHLLAADRVARIARGRTGPETSVRDLDFDGCEEVLLSGETLKAYLRPHRGGHVYEVDLLKTGFNPLATMTRRFEDYHREVEDPAAGAGEIKTIHDKRPTKGKGVKERIVYDAYAREAAVDHFFGPGATAESLVMGRAPETGDFLSGEYAVRETGDIGRATALLARRGRVKAKGKDVPVSLEKRVEIAGRGDTLRVAYAITPDDALESAFGSEYNFAMLSGSTTDRFYYIPGGEKLGPLGLVKELGETRAIGLVDEWQGVWIELAFEPAARLFLLPVETVSQSEAGYELLYQQSCVVPWWPLNLKPGEAFRPTVTVKFRTRESVRGK